ncbi:THUMP-like domain-containing protein [Microbacterium sp. YY-01]|uniref:class I SAM-dependent methyltransferase n=1 Tax=Microbacterium sp. YY-01 TaxID=3421634 RepID=UPI003D185DCE
MRRDDFALLTSPAGHDLLQRITPVTSRDDAVAAVNRLRKQGYNADLVAVAAEQALLRAQARAKFGDGALRMLLTRAGLEQATRADAARYHANRMHAAGFSRVIDLGCGLGGDSVRFAEEGMSVTAVEADEVTALLAAHNLLPWSDRTEVVHATAEEYLASRWKTAGVAQHPDASDARCALWFDPARRTAGHKETRRVTTADYSPALDWVFEQAARYPAGIKLGPGHDRDALPEHAETQWVSVQGQVVELVVWTRELARPGVGRAALVVRDGVQHELTAAADAPDAPVRDLGAYVYEPDGAVIRARLIGEVARCARAGMLDAHVAYFTSDEHVDSPFAQAFRVRRVLPLQVKALARELRAENIGRLEIKKRGVDIDPAQLRTQLKLRGPHGATVILTRIGDERVAILADRVSTAN